MIIGFLLCLLKVLINKNLTSNIFVYAIFNGYMVTIWVNF